MELVLMIAAIGLLVAFWPSIKAFATSAEVATQVTAESVIADAVTERARLHKDFKAKIESEELTIVSHEEVMDLFKTK